MQQYRIRNAAINILERRDKYLKMQQIIIGDAAIKYR